VDQVQRQMPVSQRRACRTLGQPRATQRARRIRPDRDQPLVSKLHQLSRCYPRYGYRMIAALVRQEGWQVNRKVSIGCGVKRAYRYPVGPTNGGVVETRRTAAPEGRPGIRTTCGRTISCSIRPRMGGG